MCLTSSDTNLNKQEILLVLNMISARKRKQTLLCAENIRRTDFTSSLNDPVLLNYYRLTFLIETSLLVGWGENHKHVSKKYLIST